MTGHIVKPANHDAEEEREDDLDTDQNERGKDGTRAQVVPYQMGKSK